MIPAEARIPYKAIGEASRAIDDDAYALIGWEGITRILEAATPTLLSHERERARLAHLDAMVNRETKREELAAEYRRGYRDGLADRKQVTAEPREWEPGDPVE